MQLRLTTSKAVKKMERNTLSGRTQLSLQRGKNCYLLAPCRNAEFPNPSLLYLSAGIKKNNKKIENKKLVDHTQTTSTQIKITTVG